MADGNDKHHPGPLRPLLQQSHSYYRQLHQRQISTSPTLVGIDTPSPKTVTFSQSQMPLRSSSSYSGPISLHTYESQFPSRSSSRPNQVSSPTPTWPTLRSAASLPQAEVAEHVQERGNDNSSITSPKLSGVLEDEAPLTIAERRWLEINPRVKASQSVLYESQLNNRQLEWLRKYRKDITKDPDSIRAAMNRHLKSKPTPLSLDGKTSSRRQNSEESVEVLRPTVYVPSTRAANTTPMWVTPSTILGPMDQESARPLALNIRKEGGPKSTRPMHSVDHAVQAEYHTQNRLIAPANNEKAFPRAMSIESQRVTPQDMVIPHYMHFEEDPSRISTASRTLGLTSRSAADPVEVGGHNASLQDNSIPPDGGTLAWAHAWSSLFITFNTWGLIIAFGIFEAFYQYTYLSSASPLTISWIGSVQAFFILFLGTPIGIAMDKGYFRMIFNAGSLLLVVSIFIWSVCDTWWKFFLVQGLMQGIGMGMVFCSGTIVLMTYFSKHIGTATAMSALGAPLGAIVYSVAFVQLQPQLGFMWTIRVVGFIALTTLAIPNLVFRPRNIVKSRRARATCSTFIDGPYLTMCAGLFFTYWAIFFGYYYMPLFGIRFLSLRGTEAVNILIAMAAASIPGRLLPSLVSDRCCGPLNTLFPSCFLSAALMFIWIGTSSYPSLIVVACFYGFATAGIQALYAPTVHSFSCLEPATMGQRSGVVFTVISFACLTGPPIAGALIEKDHGRFAYAQVFAGASLFLGGSLLGVARFMKVGCASARC